MVRGYKKETVDLPNLNLIDNDEFDESGELVSLLKGCGHQAGQDLIVCYGDVLFNKYIVQILAESEDALAVAIDTNWIESANRHRQADYARCSMPHSRDRFRRGSHFERSAEMAPANIHGEWMGFIKISAEESALSGTGCREMLRNDDLRRAKLPDLLNLLVENLAGRYRYFIPLGIGLTLTLWTMSSMPGISKGSLDYDKSRVLCRGGKISVSVSGPVCPVPTWKAVHQLCDRRSGQRYVAAANEGMPLPSRRVHRLAAYRHRHVSKLRIGQCGKPADIAHPIPSGSPSC